MLLLWRWRQSLLRKKIAFVSNDWDSVGVGGGTRHQVHARVSCRQKFEVSYPLSPTQFLKNIYFS